MHQQRGLATLSEAGCNQRNTLAVGIPRARLRVDRFVRRIVADTGLRPAQMEGFVALVFTAGMSEYAPVIRERVLAQLARRGFELVAAVNVVSAGRIARRDPLQLALIVPTEEESLILRHISVLFGEGAAE